MRSVACAAFAVALLAGTPVVVAGNTDINVQDQDQDQYQKQGQAQGQLQGQLQGQIAAGEQNVNVPRQHRTTPNVEVSTAPGQSGIGVSFPGGSIVGVKTDAVNQASEFVKFCQGNEGLCDDADLAAAKTHAKRSLKSCYLGGPVGFLISAIPYVDRIGIDLEGDGGILCF